MADDTSKKGLTPERQRELNELKLKDIELMKQQGKLQGEELAFVEKILKARRSNVDALAESKKSLDKEIEKLTEVINSEETRSIKLEAQRLLKEAQQEQDRIAIRAAEEKLRLGETLTKEERKHLAQAKKRNQQIASTNKHMADSKALADEIGSVWGKVSKDFGKHPFFNVKSFQKFGSAFKEPKAFFKNLGTGLLTSFIDSMIGLAFSLDQARTDFMRTTGASEQYYKAMEESYVATRKFGASIEDNVKAHSALRAGFTDFTMLTPAMTTELGNNAAMLKKWGNVAEESFGAAMQTATKFMAQGELEAAQTTREIAALAKDIGVEPSKMVEQFGNMGPQLAKFGKQGEKAFKDLARVSKITGLEMEKLISITSKFDTFEDAAKIAGQLNAAIGGNMVNAMDMMMETDPAARFEMMRDAILDTGLTFDEMSYYQKQFYAEAMGLSDVGDLALMLSGNMDALGGDIGKTSSDYEDMAEQTKNIQSLQESFNAMLADLMPILTPIIESIREFLQELRNNEEELNKIKAALTIFAHSLMFVMKNFLPLIGLFLLGPLVLTPLIGLLNLLSFSMAGAGSSAVGMGKGIGAGGAAMTKGVPALVAFGAAVLGVGLGVGAAAAGFGYLFEQINKVTDSEMVFAMVGAMFAMAGGIFAFGGALSYLGLNPATWAGVGAIVATTAAIGGLMWAYHQFTKEDYSEMTEVLNALGGAGAVSSDVEKMFKAIGTAIESIDQDKLDDMKDLFASIAYAGMFSSPILQISQAITSATSATAGGGGGGNEKPYNVTINLVSPEGELQGTARTTWLGTTVKDLTIV